MCTSFLDSISMERTHRKKRHPYIRCEIKEKNCKAPATRFFDARQRHGKVLLDARSRFPQMFAIDLVHGGSRKGWAPKARGSTDVFLCSLPDAEMFHRLHSHHARDLVARSQRKRGGRAGRLIYPPLPPPDQETKSAQMMYTHFSTTSLITPPPSPHPQKQYRPPPDLAALLSHATIASSIAPHLLLCDLLNLALVSRAVRAAIYATHLPDLEATQQMVLLLASTGQCRSSHREPVRIGVGECVWCGEGVCGVSPPLPSHRG